MMKNSGGGPAVGRGLVAVAVVLAVVGSLPFAPVAADSVPLPGSLDLSFDGDGKVVTVQESSDQGSAVAVQPDGRIVVVGSSVQPVETGSDFIVVRYNVDGSLDATFGGDGVVVTPIGPGASRDEAFAVALQPDGRIVVAGDSYEGSTSHAALARFNADGTLDPTFGGDGTVVVPMGTRSVARGVAIQDAGRIVVAGGATTLSGGVGLWVAVARLTPDGTLDSTFAGGGVVITTLGNSSGANAVTIQPDSKIVVAGQTAFFNQRLFAVLRYDPEGGADTTFGDGGTVVTEMGTGTSGGPDPIDIATAVDLDPDSRIVVAGSSSIGSSFQMAVVRYRFDGSRDPTFDLDGIVTMQVGSLSQAFAVAVDADGRSVVAGETHTAGDVDFALVRYQPDGNLDASFGSEGIVTTPFGSSTDRARGLGVQHDGRIVVAGHTDSGLTQNNVAVARYHGDLPPDTTPPDTNDPPTITVASTAVSVDEGQTASNTGTWADSDGDAVTMSASVGTVIANPEGTWTWSFGATDESDTQSVTISATDGNATTDVTFQLSVANMSPDIEDVVFTGAGGVACSSGNDVSLSFDVDDPGLADATTGTIDWGDGSAAVPYTGRSVTESHSYGAGTYTVTITAEDEDGGTDTDVRAAAVSLLYNTSGLLAPVNSDGSSVFKIGVTIPLKVVVTDCNGALVSTLTPDVDLTQLDTAPDGAVNEVVSSSAADIGDNMRCATDQYIYTLSTKRSQFCTLGNPACTDGDLVPGTYEVRISDEAVNDSFAPVTARLSLRN